MAEFTYPGSDLDRPKNLLALIGSWWATTYRGVDQTTAFMRGRGQLGNQTVLDQAESIATISRFTVPVFKRDNWYALVIRESARNNERTSLLRYGDDNNVVYGPQPDASQQFFYGTPFVRDVSAFPVPADLGEARVVLNRITSPSVTLTESIDFVLDKVNNGIIFKENPFDNDMFVQNPVFRDGVIVDHEILLWVFKAGFDLEWVYRQFGYAIALKLSSSEGYKELLNAVWDGIVGGPTKLQLEQALAAITGVPLTIEPTETVELITQDNNHNVITTDKHVYRFEQDNTPIVAEGDVLRGGEPLVDAFEIFELNRGQTPENIPAVALGDNYIKIGLMGELVWKNEETPLQVVEAADHPSGKTYISWELTGSPADVEAFFDEMHARGCDEGETLANLLDTRTNKVGEPKASNLPSEINPLEFLIENFFRYHTFLVRVRVSQLGRNAVGLENVSVIRRIIPPWTAMIILFELQQTADDVTIDKVDDDEIGSFTGAEPMDEDIEFSSVDDTTMIARQVSGTCQ